MRMLVEVCSSPLSRACAACGKQLGRKLVPHDLRYAGFRPRGQFTESALDDVTRKRYPTAASLSGSQPNILTKLSFAKDKAKLRRPAHPRRCVARAGHAMQAMRRGDFPRLRTCVDPGGMDYKG